MREKEIESQTQIEREKSQPVWGAHLLPLLSKDPVTPPLIPVHSLTHPSLSIHNTTELFIQRIAQAQRHRPST